MKRRKKKKKKHKSLVRKSLIRITVRLGSEHCIMSCLCIIVHASLQRGVVSSSYLILKNIVGSTLSWPFTIKTCIWSSLCYDCHCMAHASWGNSLKGNRTVSITHRSISIGPSARSRISHFGSSSPWDRRHQCNGFPYRSQLQYMLLSVYKGNTFLYFFSDATIASTPFLLFLCVANYYTPVGLRCLFLCILALIYLFSNYSAFSLRWPRYWQHIIYIIFNSSDTSFCGYTRVYQYSHIYRLEFTITSYIVLSCNAKLTFIFKIS